MCYVIVHVHTKSLCTGGLLTVLLDLVYESRSSLFIQVGYENPHDGIDRYRSYRLHNIFYYLFCILTVYVLK